MSRPTLEVADIVRRTGNRFSEQQQSHLAWPHRKVLDAIGFAAALRPSAVIAISARPAAIRPSHLTHVATGTVPGARNARARWLAARSAELLPVPYFHIVFTLPHSLSPLILQNKRLLYDLLFRTSAVTVLELARAPRHLGADIGLLGVFHTWDRTSSIILMRTKHRSC